MIHEKIINDLIASTRDCGHSRIASIIMKARHGKGLDLDESAALLNCEDPALVADIEKAAREIKEKIYGRRMVLFAPLYISNYCVNTCLYCGFKYSNKEICRKTLSIEEIEHETLEILKSGHKRILLVAGEDLQKCSIDHTVKAIDAMYKVDYKANKIRRINVNIAPCGVEDLRKLRFANIGTYQLFQETYHRATYEKLHTAGPKKDYEKRLGIFPKCYEAGIDDVGIGVLYGLYEPKFETLAMLSYAKYLDEKFGVGPHTISIPRLEPADGCENNTNSEYIMSDAEFKKVVAILRLSVPYTGIILSTREKPSLRAELVEIGVSQLSAGSRTEPGGYSEPRKATGQFVVSDERSLEEVIFELASKGFLPSFCTSCYRSLRTGESFMALSKSGHIHDFCDINGLITFHEYLIDFASPGTKKVGFELIKKLRDEILRPEQREEFDGYIARLDSGERDVYV